MDDRPLRLAVLCPHFAPDTAPTGEVMTRIVHELAARGHTIRVVTALPWYRAHAVDPSWAGRWMRTERTPWGAVVRVHPFPGNDKRNLARRALGFAGFTALAGLRAVLGRRVDAVIAMSPPLTLGLTGWVATGFGINGPLLFNIQDVFPDAAVETGAIRNRQIIGILRWLERVSYRRAEGITVLSEDLAANVRAKLGRQAGKVHVIPNFVDVAAIRPTPRATQFRREQGIGDEPVVMYAGNVGFSQSLDLVIAAATHLAHDPQVVFVINGGGRRQTTVRTRYEYSAEILLGVCEGPVTAIYRIWVNNTMLDPEHVGAIRVGYGEDSQQADPLVAAEALRRAGLDVAVIEKAQEDSIKAALRASTEEAQAKGVFGAPTFVTADGEVFWGNDRLEQALDWALKGHL